MKSSLREQARNAVAVALAATGGVGCASYKPANYLSQHVVPIDADGELARFDFRDPLLKNQAKPPRGKTVDGHLDLVLEAAVKDARDRGVPDGDPIRVLVHVHGGRKPDSASIKNSDQILIAMQGDGTIQPKDRWYPIFFHWPSWDIGAATSRVTSLRQGRRVGWFVRITTTPFVLVQDVITGIVRLPQSFVYQLFRDVSVGYQVATGKRILPSWEHAHLIHEAMREDGATDPFDLFKGTYRRTKVQHGVRLAAYLPSQVIKIPLQAFILEGLGQDAWDEMRRRVQSLVWLPKTFEQDRGKLTSDQIRVATAKQAPNGALPALYRALNRREEKFELFLVSHSMGAIAMNEAMESLDKQIQDSNGRLTVERILYMAPACSVAHAAESLVPFLSRHDGTQFNLLTLHPVAEADEINLYDGVPRGSLLEWIDHYYTNPSTHTERVFGKWSNAVPALNLFAKVREQVHIKAFSVGPDSVPVAHGQFHDIPFWRQEAYATSGVENYDKDWLSEICATCTGPGKSHYKPW